MIAIVDYQAGNLASVKKALDHLGFAALVTANPADVIAADKIILPGVGHFAATQELTRSGLRDAIAGAVARGVPFLGICVGMQWMYAGSEEAPEIPGLGLLPGRCARFSAGIKVPHVGWNDMRQLRPSRLLDGVAPGAFVYYTHSYRAPACDATVAASEYGGEFAAVVERGSAFGVQFHPEKSADAGLRLLRNFCGIEGTC